MEMIGFPDAARDQVFKLASINLCPNISGQITTTLMMNPPTESEPSYELYNKVRSWTCGWCGYLPTIFYFALQ
jgi:alanine transaminase